MRFLDPGTVVAMNRLTIQRHGGMFIPPDNIRSGQDLGFIEQIRVNKLFGRVLYRTPYHQAGAYFFYISRNHTFHDGNKRTALACAWTLLEWNGLPFREVEAASAEKFILSVASSRSEPAREIERIARWLGPEERKRRRRGRKG